jgi:hypothetical protein
MQSLIHCCKTKPGQWVMSKILITVLIQHSPKLYNSIFALRIRVFLLQICHFLSYIFIISGTTFLQECVEDADDDILILVDEDVVNEMDKLFSDLNL